MNVRSVLPILLQLAESAGGNPAAIAGLVTTGIGAINNLRGAKTDEDRLAAAQQLYGVAKGLMNKAEGEELTAQEAAEFQSELDADTALLAKKFDFRWGG